MWLKKRRKNFKYAAYSEQRLANRKGLTAIRYPLIAEKGFTLIEILVATSILGVIGLTILTTFASGLQVFDRVQAFGGSQANVLLALEEMERDIKNIFPFSTVAFEGGSQSISFPAVIEIVGDGDEEDVVSSIGRISYYVDDATYVENVGKSLIRAQQKYSSAIAAEGMQGDQAESLASIEDLAFEYYYYDEEAETYGWQSSWGAEEESILSGVKIEVTYKDSARDVVIERVVLIPALQKIVKLKNDEKEGEEGGDEE